MIDKLRHKNSMEKENFWHSLSWREVIKKLNSDPKKGLSEKEAEFRLKKFGKNKLPEKKALSKIEIFSHQFRSPLIYILIIVGIVVLILEDYPQNFFESSFVFAAIIINALFGFWEENKSSETFKKLKKILKSKAVVIREGNKKEILQEEVVLGDLIIFSSGDKIPADGRLIEAENLEISEAVLTGEWLPTAKRVEPLPLDTPLADRDNMVFAGCLVENGRGRAVVTAVGRNTEVGKITTLIQETEEEKTPLQKKLVRFGKLIGGVIVAITFFIFLIGIAKQYKPIEMFEIAAAIAVGGIPEALPVVMTLILAIGMENLAKRKGLVRRLASVETLGGTSVICCDKTKTLTQGKMEMAEVISENKNLALKIATLCNEAFIENPKADYKDWKVRGSPTDKALVMAGAKFGIFKPKLEKEYKILKEIFFDPTKKYQAVFVRKNDEDFLFISGAPEKVLELSKLNEQELNNLKEKLGSLTEKGLRIIGLGYKEVKNQNSKIEDEILNNFNFVGFISLKDPLRSDVKEAIQICKDSGLKPVIITGDHKNTAMAIAKEIGLEVKDENILEGKDLDKISDDGLFKRIRRIKIYARAEPRHKIRIIRAWQENGEVVAMTGDGVNDAPALKKADIGLALGSGSEVAKEVADLVLLNDSFNIIVKAIREGRRILDNLRKAIAYILADSFTSVILVGMSIIFGWPLPILWTQILWNNVVEDTLPDIAYAFEPEGKGIMKRAPASPKTPLLTKEMKILIFGTGLIDEFLTLILFWIFWRKLGFSLDYARTMVFGAISIDTAFVVFCYKNLRKNLWKINPFNNKFLLIASGLVFAGFALAIYLSPFQTLLNTVPLGPGSWLILIGVGVLSMFLIEITKWYFISRRETEE